MNDSNSEPLSTPQLKSELLEYESLAPEMAIRHMSFALIGSPEESKLKFGDKDPVPSTYENVIRAIEDELKRREAGKKYEDYPPEMEAKLPIWIRLLQTISHLAKKTDPITYEFRKYDTANDTPAEINEQGKDGPFGLLNHAQKIIGSASLIAYQLENDEYAVILNRETNHSIFSVKRSGVFYGSFEVDFTSDLEAYIKNNLHTNNWYRPQEVSSTQSTTNKTTETVA